MRSTARRSRFCSCRSRTMKFGCVYGSSVANCALSPAILPSSTFVRSSFAIQSSVDDSRSRRYTSVARASGARFVS